MQLILGSSSPRRQEILRFFSIPFRQASPDFDESTLLFSGDGALFAKEAALQKGLSLQKKHPNDLILTADTVVFQNGRLFLKPKTMEEAQEMLEELSGKEHSVYTGVSVIKENQQFLGVEESCVLFHELTQNQIQKYHTHFLPLDKAGAYAIQKGGSLIVKRIEGCYYNIMGLPIALVSRLLKDAGIDLWDYLQSV